MTIITFKILNGHRKGEKACLLKTSKIKFPDTDDIPIVMLQFEDGEKFGYRASDVEAG